MKELFLSENLKILYDKKLLAVLISILVFVPFMTCTLGSFSGESGDLLSLSKLLQGSYLGQAGFIVFSAMYCGKEFQRSSLRTSLLSFPSRSLFWFSKLVNLILWSSLIFLFDSLSSYMVILCDGSLTAADPASLLPAFSSAYISDIELVILTFSLTILTSSAIASMAVPLSLLLGMGSLLLQYGNVMKYLPVNSSMNSFLILPAPIYPDKTEGLIIQGIWAFLFALISLMSFRKKCVR